MCAAATAMLLVLMHAQQPGGGADYDAGRRAAAERHWSQAAKHFEAAVGADSSRSIYWMWLGRAMVEQARRGGLIDRVRFGPRVKPALVRAVTLDPANDEARVILIEFLLRAPRVVGGSGRDAAAHADTIARRNAYLGSIIRARFAEHRGDSAEARDQLRRIVASYPDSSAPYAVLFNLLSSSSGHAEGAALAERLLSTRCCRRLGLYYTARMALHSGTGLERGVETMREYIRAGAPPDGEPSLAYAHLRLGQILERLGRLDAARAEYEAALREEPDFALARAELKRPH